MSKQQIRRLLAVAILLATVFLFTRYLVNHPAYWQALKRVSPWAIVWILVLNIAAIFVLALINDQSIRACRKQLPRKELFLLTAYSSLVNFFGPLQSGPGVRAAYLKVRHKVRLRDYALAGLLPLAMYAFFSALFLLVGTRPWWQTFGALVLVAGFSALVIRWFKRRDKKPSESQLRLTPRILTAMLVLTFLQVVIVSGWYYVELHAVNPQIHLSQAISYSGAANFSLFVSVTPDAVGIREAFLVFSQHIHHVATGDIVTANIVDRAAYVLFLLLLFAVVLGLHAKDKLGLRQLRKPGAAGNEQ